MGEWQRRVDEWIRLAGLTDDPQVAAECRGHAEEKQSLADYYRERMGPSDLFDGTWWPSWASIKLWAEWKVAAA